MYTVGVYVHVSIELVYIIICLYQITYYVNREHSNFGSVPQLTSTGDGFCQYSTDGSNNKELHHCLFSSNLLPKISLFGW